MMGRADHLLMACVVVVAVDASVTAASPCPADLDQSGVVTGIDLALLLGAWGACPPSLPGPPDGPGGGSSAADSTSACPADLDASGSVNGFDLGILLGAWGNCPLSTPPKIIYTPVAHEGDPAPGIDFPGVVYDILGTPQIDVVGDVLFWAWLFGPTLPSSADIAIYHGPPGKVMPILREGDQAPGLPSGVFIKNLYFSQYRICETGQIVATAELGGSGIMPGVNDHALFLGNPRQGQPLTKLLQLGDPAPGVETNPELAGLTLGSDGGTFFGAELSDNGTLALFALLKGPGIPPDVYHKAVWTGPPDDLQLVYRDGMPAPGLPAGVTFAWLDLPSINDLGQLAFRGLVQGPGITDDNDMGRWIGGPGDLQLYTAAGMPAPQQDSGVTFVQGGGGGHSPLNNLGDCGDLALVQGRGIGPQNNLVSYVGPPGDMTLVMQEGDPAPEAGTDVEIDSIGSLYVNDDANVWYRVRYRGLGIDDSNEWAMYLGLLGNPLIALRDSEPAPTFARDVVLSRVVAASSLSALNDIGDVVTVTEIAGPDVTPTDKVVLWMRDTSFGGWYPLLRGAQAIGSRVASIPTTGSLSGAFWQLTGGADGYGLGFNDQRRLAIKIPFTDGTEGLFVIEPAR